MSHAKGGRVSTFGYGGGGMHGLARSQARRSCLNSARRSKSAPCSLGQIRTKKKAGGFAGFLDSGGGISNPRPSGYEHWLVDRLNYVELGFKQFSRDRPTSRSAGICRACVPFVAPAGPLEPQRGRHILPLPEPSRDGVVQVDGRREGAGSRQRAMTAQRPKTQFASTPSPAWGRDRDSPPLLSR
jgi:hypothetical protein